MFLLTQTKTDTEGPLFLYQRYAKKHSTYTRSEAPFYCLYILNRNDPENFSIGVTPDNDIELSNEFIICRPEHAGTWHAHLMRQTQRAPISTEFGSLSLRS